MMSYKQMITKLSLVICPFPKFIDSTKMRGGYFCLTIMLHLCDFKEPVCELCPFLSVFCQIFYTIFFWILYDLYLPP